MTFHDIRFSVIPALMLAAAIGGCSNGNPLTTSALFGGSAAQAPAPLPQAQNDPVSRAMQVGSTSARALKCGFNFDPVKLRTQFLAAEAAANPAPEIMGRATQVYDTAFNGVKKAVAGQGEGYCSNQKTVQIKEALTRHLAGDYTPPPPQIVAEEEGGLFGGLGSSGSGSSTEGMAKFQKPMSEW